MARGKESRRKVQLRDVVLGSGRPALILPLVPRNLRELQEMTEEALNCRTDILEWRADYFEEVEDCERVKEALALLRKMAGNSAILVTPRHVEENLSLIHISLR